MTRRMLFIAALAISATACKTTKTADLELAAAEAALDKAKTNRASDCAKEIYAAAESVIAEAKALADKGEHDKARAKAIEGETLANQARAASPPGCDKTGEEVADPALDKKAGGDQNASRGAESLDDLLETIYFDYNEASIREDSKAVLSKVANALLRGPSSKLEIEGHCDERGSTEYNLHLGERRARAVEKYLVTQGVSPTLLTTISYGEERPVDLGDTESAHAKNRRAELKRQ